MYSLSLIVIPPLHGRQPVPHLPIQKTKAHTSLLYHNSFINRNPANKMSVPPAKADNPLYDKDTGKRKVFMVQTEYILLFCLENELQLAVSGIDPELVPVDRSKHILLGIVIIYGVFSTVKCNRSVVGIASDREGAGAAILG